MSHESRRDDPIFYKKSFIGLISEANENDIVVTIGTNKRGVIRLEFTNEIGECAEVELTNL